SCISVPDRNRVSPPSCRMPTSKDTRVRVEGFSKIMASILPASGLSAVPALVACFRTFASSRMVRRSPAETAERSRKCFADAMSSTRAAAPNSLCRFLYAGFAEGFGCAFDTSKAVTRLLGGNHQRRQEPHDVVARHGGEDVLGAHRSQQVRVRAPGLYAEHQAFAADLLDHLRETVLQAFQPLAEDERHIPHMVQEAFGKHDIENGI